MFSFRYISNVCKQKQTLLVQIIILKTAMTYWYCNMPFNHGGKALIKSVYTV